MQCLRREIQCRTSENMVGISMTEIYCRFYMRRASLNIFQLIKLQKYISCSYSHGREYIAGTFFYLFSNICKYIFQYALHEIAKIFT